MFEPILTSPTFALLKSHFSITLFEGRRTMGLLARRQGRKNIVPGHLRCVFLFVMIKTGNTIEYWSRHNLSSFVFYHLRHAKECCQLAWCNPVAERTPPQKKADPRLITGNGQPQWRVLFVSAPQPGLGSRGLGVALPNLGGLPMCFLPRSLQSLPTPESPCLQEICLLAPPTQGCPPLQNKKVIRTPFQIGPPRSLRGLSYAHLPNGPGKRRFTFWDLY